MIERSPEPGRWAATPTHRRLQRGRVPGAELLGTRVGRTAAPRCPTTTGSPPRTTRGWPDPGCTRWSPRASGSSWCRHLRRAGDRSRARPGTAAAARRQPRQRRAALDLRQVPQLAQAGRPRLLADAGVPRAVAAGGGAAGASSCGPLRARRPQQRGHRAHDRPEAPNWWLNNRVYPVTFAWQSGPVETLLDQLDDTVGDKLPFGGIGIDLVEQLDRLVERLARSNVSVDVGRDEGERAGSLGTARSSPHRVAP